MKTIRNILKVAASNVVSIICGILVSFIIPKLLSVPGYGMYKVFTLYVSYLGLFSIGLIDGIVLKYGAKDYNELSPREFRAYFKWYLLINLIFSLLFGLVGIIISQISMDYMWIAIMLGINLLAVNITGYFQQISQITQRFSEYSARKIIQSGLNILIIILFALLIKFGVPSDYRIFLVFTILVNAALAGWYLFTYRKIVYGEAISFHESKSSIVALIKCGFPLLFANLCSTLIMSLDRQFVSMLFSTEEYAIYAFAYSMLSLVTVATSAVSTVLYPFLKRLDFEQFKEKYNDFLVIVTVCVFFVVSAFFPLCYIIEAFLPKYIDSIAIFRIIIPGVAISSSITVIMHNYYKTLGLSSAFFKKSIIVLIVSCVANVVAFLCFRSMQSISIASVITILFWYIFTNHRLKKDCTTNTVKNTIYILLGLVCFYVASAFEKHIIGLIIYLALIISITIAFYYNDIKRLLSRKFYKR